MPPTFILSQNQTLQLVICINSSRTGPEKLKSLLKCLRLNYLPKQTANQYGLVIGSQGRGYKEPRLESH